jgi:hypothetical protein
VTALPPQLELLEADISGAAARRARQLRTRRRAACAAGVSAALLLMAGAGLAASGAGIFGWLAASEPGEARFAVDASRVYAGSAPRLLSCEDASGDTFSCAPGASGARVYELLLRAHAPEPVTRELALAGIEEAVRTGGLDQGRAQQVMADLRAVPDDFFAKLATLSTFTSVGVGSGVDSGSGARELVPPPGVSYLVECEQREPSSFGCRPLAGAPDVPVGAPIYALHPSSDWQERVPQPTQGGAADVLGLVAAVWGRPLEPAEVRLLHVASETAVESGSSGGATADAP